ncbi:MAG: flagellar biosynthesis anti-sigma factor FlgM [Defluviitaleaceae bacterium]|nr:flagellar biosynthesis anti-sigma factor FlgM [Defluviitaleaceae bacterium]
MDIRITGAYGVYKTQPVTKTGAPFSIKGSVKANAIDSVSFSAVANELNVARRAMREVPDVREARVVQLREQLNSGTYEVSAADIAARIFGVGSEE